MSRLVYFLLSLPFLLLFTTTADAGPACARRNEGTDACISKCRDKWGWPGHAMGTDRWGQVLTKTITNDMGAVVTKACRVRPSGGLASASTTSIASSTSPLLVPPPSVAPANVIVSASAGTVTSSASSASLRALTHSSSATKKVSLAPLVASTTAPATTSSTTSAKPTTTSTKPKPTTTSTHTTTSHTEAPPPPPPETTTTKKTTTQQPAATPNAGDGNKGNSGSSNNNGNSGSSNNNNGNSGSGDNNNGNSGNGDADSDASGGSTSQSDIEQYLQAHNSVRSQHGASPLTWSNNLADKAQQWANNCVFQHSGGKLGPFGENLAAGTGSSYGIQSAVKSWTDEVSEYDSNNPQPSHFTQVVWKASTQVGCAVQSCNGIFDAKFGAAKFFVCEYSPQGNVIGQFGKNVQA